MPGDVDYVVRDFNGADRLFGGAASAEWSDLDSVLRELRPHLHASDQAGKVGTPIFDPKGTNAALTEAARSRDWVKVPVPEELTMFGVDWDAGKGTTLAEWQFSNYPFLWNNVIRTQAGVNGKVVLAGVGTTEGLIVVTKSGLFPASNSTLYFEQAAAQLEAVMARGTFSLPIRLVGLTVPEGTSKLKVVWTDYGARYVRAVGARANATMSVQWSPRRAKYGHRAARFTLAG